ncbi:uncharacterized protein LOC62_01G000452 [Vanrija pseudolonga]|uniref:WHIM1 domain-containing protein n=1 Tax=Vanrija pseudolonga TaxID=143232 RepID=A0AAF0XZK0_9TREE|nr:hypothetical protein LOC62_01G000452 [Vanrija pseudolonga]
MPRVADAPVKREAGARGSAEPSESTAASPHANGHAHKHANGNGTPIKVDGSDDGAEAAADAAPTFLEEAKRRHEADLAKHAYEPPRPERVQDDWQVAYTWAFIVKFNLRDKIRRLECLEDFERCLTEPVANRPDDVLEGVLVRFLANLKPGLRNLDCTNIQSHLSNYISDMLLNSSEFTVWDRPWPPNEEARGGCCNPSEERLELGRLRYLGEDPKDRVLRNPLKQMEARGGGLFELDWHERARLLRQLVDWQLTHSEVIRAIIKEHEPTSKRSGELDAAIKTEPIGLDRGKSRIWSLDSSARLYKSGNPFKRPCPFVAITTTRAELQEQQAVHAAHGESKPEKPAGTGPKGKLKPSELLAYRRQVKGVEDEAKLATWLAEDLIPRAEKEELRVQRARTRIVSTLRAMQQAELRSTRTRRSTKKVDYTYDSVDVGLRLSFDLLTGQEDDEPPRRGGRRGAAEASFGGYEPSKARPVIPGERRSARVSRRAEIEEDEYDDAGEGGEGSGSVSAPPSPPAAPQPMIVEVVPPPGVKKVKGYTWVEEVVPVGETGGPVANGSSPGVSGVSEAIEVDDD